MNVRSTALGLAAATLLLGAAVAPQPVRAQADPPPVASPDAEVAAAMHAAAAARRQGPASIELLDQATLQLPAGYAFIPRDAASRLMHAIGNPKGEDLVGLVIGDLGFVDQWFVVISFRRSGYIKDDDARDWNADALLQSLREGNEQANGYRRAHFIPEVEVVGWVERPAYDGARHRLVWAASTRDKGSAADGAHGVNYNTYALGRDGYFSLNLVTDLATVDRDKPNAHRLLAALEYRDGKKYTDFNAGTDHVAEYGLGALVAGVAAKKLGLFALAGVLLLKFWKLIALGAIVLGGAAFKLFERRSGRRV